MLVVSLEKTRALRSRLKSRGLSLEIRCKANLLSLKALFLALGTANKHIAKLRNSNANLYANKLASHMRNLDILSYKLKSSYDIDPNFFSRDIESAIKTYVDMFYALSKDERKHYIESFSKVVTKSRTKIKPERNMLLLPAMMAELKLPKDEVSSGLFHFLYKLPFAVLYDSSKSALRVALFEQNMAIRTVPYNTIEDFSSSLSKIEDRIKSIDNGSIKPLEDEDIKADFVAKALDFSKASEINIGDLISERVGTEAATLTRMHRIIRRSKY